MDGFNGDALATIALLPGCAAVALTAGGVGLATGVSHTLGGIVYKTFSAPEAKVHGSTVAASRKECRSKIVETSREGNKALIKAQCRRPRNRDRASITYTEHDTNDGNRVQGKQSYPRQRHRYRDHPSDREAGRNRMSPACEKGVKP